MAVLVADCPRCGSKAMTFDVESSVFRFQQYKWQNWHEFFSVCRNCHKPTIFLISMKTIEATEAFRSAGAIVKYDKSLNSFFDVDRFISLRDQVPYEPPEHLPKELHNAFEEAAACLAIGCHNAAACMFRLCIDLATKPLLLNSDDGSLPEPSSKQRRDLGLRLAWLFDNKRLPGELRELAKCVREDANDGAHAGTLGKEDAEDLLDFTQALLERLITEPKRLELAEARRLERRKSKG